MNDLRKERLMISIATLAGIICILQNFFADWEPWVPAVVFAGMIAMWFFHVAQKLNSYSRVIICFIYAGFLEFYHGIHDTSLYEVSIALVLFMATFTIADSIALLDWILAEYGIIMVIQFYFLYRDNKLGMSAFEAMRIAFHFGTVIVMYVFSRITVKNRISEKERIREWLDKVKENDHDMEDFLSNISHELRTPVNVISGMTTILQKNNDSKELSSIQEAGIRLAHQIEDIQDYTEIKRGELVLENENYMCISLINDVVEYYRSVQSNSDLELVIDLAPDTPTMLNGDIKKLHKIFRHILGNAIKFTRRGGVFIKVFSVPQEYGCNLTIEITDTGIGMTRAQMARTSKGMYQANKKRNRSTGGIGIGLPIVYGFVHKMGGFVRIDSERKKGTTVRITVPQIVADASPCLSLSDSASGGIVFFIDPTKYKVPEIREFYTTMAVNLANGIRAKLYSAENGDELERIVDEKGISYIFTGNEEYAVNKSLLDRLAGNGCRIVINAGSDFTTPVGNGITVLPKPLYGFPVVRILNGESGLATYDGELQGRPRFTGVSALIVDDEPMNLVVASGLLREYKMFADTAESGKEAIRKYTEGDYDVIFMDHMMPEMDGVEAMKRIREVAVEKGKNPVMIALTANALSGAREMFMREGFDGFVAKPIDITEFERVMKKVLPADMIRFEGRDDT